MSATTEMKMLQLIKGITLLDVHRNKEIRTELNVYCILENDLEFVVSVLEEYTVELL